MELVALLQSLQFPLPEDEKQGLEHKLERHINYLIQNDFNRLVQLLYTVDVDEQKLKQVLLQQPERDAAALIADLVLNREKEKIQLRQQLKKPAITDNEERW